MRHEELIDVPCSVTRPLAILGERWTLVLITQAFAGTRRFEDFHATLGISRARLADRLDLLVGHGILSREPYKDGRTRHEYRLTAKGLDLYPVLMAIRAWGDRHLPGEDATLPHSHEGCGGELHVRVECDRCHAPVETLEAVPEEALGAG